MRAVVQTAVVRDGWWRRWQRRWRRRRRRRLWLWQRVAGRRRRREGCRAAAKAVWEAQEAAVCVVAQTAAVVRVFPTEARQERRRAATKVAAEQAAAARVAATEAYRKGC